MRGLPAVRPDEDENVSGVRYDPSRGGLGEDKPMLERGGIGERPVLKEAD